ncbi:hydroxymethylglutaryl-CoA synthase [Candidatus Roizmanbacteria bacterium]|nr:hydroxymethylglutaryl-CoA synthase [Candidatus Roizmanbacteria bacterium]
MMIGISSYGAYVPRFRIKTEDIASVWKKEAEHVTGSLGVTEKSVAATDEDTVTLAYEAARAALTCGNLPPDRIGSVFVGSESHPYAVNATATIVGEFLGIGRNYFAADLEFACKAATTGLIATAGLLSAGKISYGLTVGADCAQAKPHDILEYTAASGAGALIASNIEKEVAVEIVDYLTYSSDTPDFWRRDGISYPSHGGRFTGEPAYFTHVMSAAEEILSRNKKKPSDFDYCVLHMPNGKFPRIAAKRLGFSKEQLTPSLTVDSMGNAYSATPLLGLIATLDVAKPNQTILFVSYGSGASSDAFILRTTSRLLTIQKQSLSLADLIKNKTYISYVDYLKIRGKI